jgi:hypothetical protein
LLEAVERSDRAGDGGACTGGGGGVEISSGRGGDDDEASYDAGVPVKPVGGGRGKEGEDVALAAVYIPGELGLYMVGGLGGRCGLCMRMDWGSFFRGPLELQGDWDEGNRAG